MYSITNLNSLTYNNHKRYSINEMNGADQEKRNYSYQNMNGYSDNKDVVLHLLKLNICS
ncbi:MAG: hypothetical protein Q4F05_14550 [bacterium]|nr:hypothetical protein [bacterium]